MADEISEAIRTKAAFNAALNVVWETFGIEKFHEEQRKAIDLFFDGKDVFEAATLNSISRFLKAVSSAGKQGQVSPNLLRS